MSGPENTDTSLPRPKRLTSRVAQRSFEDVTDTGGPADPFIGSTVGDYVLEKALGTDKRSDVYLAHHEKLGTQSAIKILKAGFCEAIRKDEKQFLERVRQRTSIRHKNVLLVQDAGRIDDRYYVVTEFVDGRRLEDVLDIEGVMPVEKAVDIMQQICTALIELHRGQILHCGLTPYTTLVEKTGVVKVAAFGLSQMADEQAGPEDTSLMAAQYVSPEEAASGLPTDILTDIYAAGCILYRMLIGKAPFTGATRELILQQHAKETVPVPRSVAPNIPADVSDLLLSMLEKDPRKRPQTADAVLECLQQLPSVTRKKETLSLDKPGGAARENLERLFRYMAEYQASDLHLKAGSPPVYRIRGETQPVRAAALTEDNLKAMVNETLTADQVANLKEERSIDVAVGLEDVGRFRLNIFYQRGSLSLCVRRVNSDVPSLTQLNLPECLGQISTFRDGLALVSGPTGCGKSTTLAAIISMVNERRRAHVITIEDPVEYVHEDRMSFITQREVGIDVPSFLAGLRDALRQDPDVILLGELRDAATMETALSASETGHMVMSTLHAKDVVEGIVRILNFFPRTEQEKIRKMLSDVLRAIIAQKMVPGCRDDQPRVVATEVLFVNDVIQQCIADGDDHRIPNQFRTFADIGMMSFNMSLLTLVRKGLVDSRIAIQESNNPVELQSVLSGI